MPSRPGHPRGRRRLFGGEAVLRLWAGQRPHLPDGGGRHRRAAGRAADAGGRVRAILQGTAADDLLRRADAVCGAAGEPRACRARGELALRVCTSRRRGAAGGHRRALDRALRRRDPRRHRLDRDAAHLPVQPPGRGALRHHAASRCRATSCASSATTASRCATARSANCRSRGPTSAATCTGTTASKHASTFLGPWTRSGDKYIARRRRLLHLLRPQRRHAEGRRHLRLAVRGRGRAHDARRRARGRRDRHGRRGRPGQAQGLSWCSSRARGAASCRGTAGST